LGRLEATKIIPDQEEVPGSSLGSPTCRNSGLRCICTIFRFLAVEGATWSGCSVGPRWGHQLLPACGKALLVARRRQVGARSEYAVRRVLSEPAGARGTVSSAVGGPAGRHRPPRAGSQGRRLRDRGRHATAWRSPCCQSPGDTAQRPSWGSGGAAGSSASKIEGASGRGSPTSAFAQRLGRAQLDDSEHQHADPERGSERRDDRRPVSGQPVPRWPEEPLGALAHDRDEHRDGD